MAFRRILNSSPLRLINRRSDPVRVRFPSRSDVAAAGSPAVALFRGRFIQKRVPYFSAVPVRLVPSYYRWFPVTGANAGYPLVATGAATSSGLFVGCYIQKRVPYFSAIPVHSVPSYWWFRVTCATAGSPAVAADAAASSGVSGGRYIQRRVPYFSAVPVTSVRRTESCAVTCRAMTPIHHIQGPDVIPWEITVADIIDQFVSLGQIFESNLSFWSLLLTFASEFAKFLRALAAKKANPMKVHLGAKRLVIEKLAVTDDNVEVKVQCAFDVKVVNPRVIVQKQCWNYLADTSAIAAVIVKLNMRLSTVGQLTEPRMQLQILHHIKRTTDDLGVTCERIQMTVFDAEGKELSAGGLLREAQGGGSAPRD